jgi:hypothetical protein
MGLYEKLKDRAVEIGHDLAVAIIEAEGSDVGMALFVDVHKLFDDIHRACNERYVEHLNKKGVL